MKKEGLGWLRSLIFGGAKSGTKAMAKAAPAMANTEAAAAAPGVWEQHIKPGLIGGAAWMVPGFLFEMFGRGGNAPAQQDPRQVAPQIPGASYTTPGWPGVLNQHRFASADPERRLAFEVGAEKFCKEAGMNKEAILPAVPALLGGAARIFGPMLAMEGFNWLLNKGRGAGAQRPAVPGASRVGGGRLGALGRRPGGFGRVGFASDDSGKALAFEVGVEKFCKEAGLDEEDTADLILLLKNASNGNESSFSQQWRNLEAGGMKGPLHHTSSPFYSGDSKLGPYATNKGRAQAWSPRTSTSTQAKTTIAAPKKVDPNVPGSTAESRNKNWFYQLGRLQSRAQRAGRERLGEWGGYLTGFPLSFIGGSSEFQRGEKEEGREFAKGRQQEALATSSRKNFEKVLRNPHATPQQKEMARKHWESVRAQRSKVQKDIDFETLYAPIFDKVRHADRGNFTDSSARAIARDMTAGGFTYSKVLPEIRKRLGLSLPSGGTATADAGARSMYGAAAQGTAGGAISQGPGAPGRALSTASSQPGALKDQAPAASVSSNLPDDMPEPSARSDVTPDAARMTEQPGALKSPDMEGSLTNTPEPRTRSDVTPDADRMTEQAPPTPEQERSKRQMQEARSAGMSEQAVQQAARVSEPPSARQYPGERHEPFTDAEMAQQEKEWEQLKRQG